MQSCRICRKRKVKCDRSPGGCHRCRQYGEECIYAPSTVAGPILERPNSDGITTEAGLKRRRILHSCLQCKRAKAKCSGGATCTACARKGLECSYYKMGTVSRQKPGLEPSISTAPSHSIPAWLTATTLPPINRIRELVDIYFSRIHTVRCMGFLHIPTFMKRLKDPEQLYSQQSGLIYIICALSAPFYYADTLGVAGEEDQKNNIQLFDAGKGWAEAASQSLFSSFGQTGNERLMTEVLLHEYYLRQGDYAKGFMISGQIARHLQILQLNIELDSDPLCQKSRVSSTTKETRRRLVWACYILDAFIECGIDQLRLILSEDIYVQLPCSEDLFVRSTPCLTEILSPGKLLPSVTPTPKTITEASNNLDMRGFYIRALTTRSRILKYVKHLAGEIPWQPSSTSQFHALKDELHALEASIPPSLQITTENMYLFKASGRLTLYFSLHILISQNYHDLYRIGVSHLVFPNSATKWIRENAPNAFLVTCHTICAQKAVYIASLLKDLWDCHRLSIVDTPFAMYIQVCSSVIVTTLASWGRDEPLIPGLGYGEYRAMLRDNVVMLRFLQRYVKASMYCESAVQALNRFDELFSLDATGRGSAAAPALVEAQTASSTDWTGDSSQLQLSLEYVLNPLGTYPLARKQVQNGDGGEAEGICPGEDMPPAGEIAVVDNGNRPSGDDDPGGFPIPGEMLFPGNILDWELEMPMMSGIGYPTFLEHFSVDELRGL